MVFLLKGLKPPCWDIRSPAGSAFLLKPAQRDPLPPRTCSDAGRGGSEDLPAVLGHDQQFHLLLGRRVVLLQDQEFAVLVQEIVTLDICGTGWGGKEPIRRMTREREEMSRRERRRKSRAERERKRSVGTSAGLLLLPTGVTKKPPGDQRHSPLPGWARPSGGPRQKGWAADL